MSKKIKTCKYCGTKIYTNNGMCTYCGEKIKRIRKIIAIGKLIREREGGNDEHKQVN